METIIPLEGRNEIEDPYPTPTDDQLSQVIRIASLGIRPAVMSECFSVSLHYLYRACSRAIAGAAREPHKAILRALHEMALSQRYPAVSVFWAKTFAADLLPAPPASTSQKPPKPEPQRYRSNDEPFELNVYCNDGEPNHPL